MASKNPLLDEVFLQKLYLNRHKEIYAKIIALNLQEEPIEQIEGQITGGSVSLDGSSNVRRSCNLTMIAQDIDINAYYWGFKNKIKLFVGLKNDIDDTYEDIIWFPFGVMVITNFSTSQAASGYTISINAKDKMCLINGELGGSLFAAVDFGKEEYYDSKTMVTTISDIPIERIVREAIHEYAQEPWENIIINDLEDLGLELLDYKGSKPLYLIISEGETSDTFLGDVIQMTWDGTTPLYCSSNLDDDSSYQISSSQITYNPRTKLNFENASIGTYSILYYGAEERMPVSIAKIEYGQTCGYRYTDITYAGDLICNTGEPVTSMLDKLVTMLGNWEYFYDVDGRFVFQRKRTYLDKTWNTIVTNNDANNDGTSYVPTSGETYVESALWSSAVSWNFTDSFLVTAFNNSPVLNNVKNDYSIWGTRMSVDGTELPVHLRYAIDKKPNYYRCISGSQPNTLIEYATINGRRFTNKGTIHYNEDLAKNNKYVFSYKNTDYEIGDCLKLDFGKLTSTDKTIDLYNEDTELSSTASVNNKTSGSHSYKEYYEPSQGWVVALPNSEDTGIALYWVSYKLTNYQDVINTVNTVEYMTPEEAVRRGRLASEGVDWREIIFQMAKDFRRYAHYDPTQENKTNYTDKELLYIAENFSLLIRLNNGKLENGEWRYPTGKTGYEQYYTDIEGFWRQLYCPPMLLTSAKNWRNTGVWTDRATNISEAEYIENNETVSVTLDNAAKTNILYFLSTNWVDNGSATRDGWNRDIIDNPAGINFWFDFLDADKDSDFAKYSIPVIGDRAKSVNDNMVKAIYFREVPNTIFTPDVSTLQRKSGYTYMQYSNNSNMEALFNMSTQGKCAIDVMEEWINNYVYAIESVSITAVPIYHLQPNTRIKVMDIDSKINGDYIVSRISIPLTYNGTMSITATKVADRVY